MGNGNYGGEEVTGSQRVPELDPSRLIGVCIGVSRDAGGGARVINARCAGAFQSDQSDQSDQSQQSLSLPGWDVVGR